VNETILIVDDEPNIVISLEYLLEHAGYHVLVARDGQEALDTIRLMMPELVLLDVMLPSLSGFEVCEAIRDNPAWHRIRVVLLTARGREAEVSKGLALGANAYVTKPFSTKELLAQIRAQLDD
jgi:DNA-binding response OmpR family regulator